MYYTVVPPDILYMDMEKPRKFFDIQKNDVVYKLEEINENEYMIFDIFSLNLSDYMNPAIAPGTILKKRNMLNFLI